MSADATTRYENVKKYKCHVTIEQWNNRSNLIIKLSKSYSKKNNRKKNLKKYLSVMSADATTEPPAR